jgi:hypothetical protein
LSGRSAGLAPGEPAADRGQPAKDGIAQPVAQKLAATRAGIRRNTFHRSPIAVTFRHPAKTGLTFFAQALTFLGLFHRSCEND